MKTSAPTDYQNPSQLLRDKGLRLRSYLSRKRTRQYLAKVSEMTSEELIIRIRTGKSRGVWVHPLVWPHLLVWADEGAFLEWLRGRK